MNTLIYAPLAEDSDRARKQREEPEAWHLPHMRHMPCACSGNCEQGRHCDCTSNSAKCCSDPSVDAAAFLWEHQDAEVVAHMYKLTPVVLALCFLAWVVA
ncbi:hypothetical protein [Roseateles oligotrophus]|uniref:Uncharacterized protein n=1 Tax=Roseateles oligotrophus TaxID=1769250 RepID=A0ABT2YKI6_9BURK|nr:hypothetical protein [Roseateles oligotrophus]MCV2370568.1 hypothetical protein [Roseateles oligotrophus]